MGYLGKHITIIDSTIKKIAELNIYKLFELNLSIPEYQRPYMWEKDQVEDLLNDFESARKEGKEYLIGNIIFHKEEQKLNIVDAQQRIITLALILYNLEKKNNKFLENIKIDNPLSQKAIYTNNQIIKNWIDGSNIDKEKLLKFINNNIHVTYIVANSLDEAFILFDSQNTRGKALNRHDLLKAHHLRFIESDSRILLAKEWEKIDEYHLKYLLEILLLQSRQYIRGEYRGSQDIYHEFKSTQNSNVMNSYNQVPIFNEFTFDLNSKKMKLLFKDDVEFNLHNGLIIHDALKYLPFEILQSIGGGEPFFWFVLKYDNLNRELQRYISTDLKEIHDVMKSFNYGGNKFLVNFFNSTMLFYYDKFEKNKIDDFAFRLFWLISHYRLNKYSVRFDGVVKFLREELNIYQLIYFSYSSDEVIDKLDNFIRFEKQPLSSENIKKGVRENYYTRVKDIRKLQEIKSLLSGGNNE